ncbi:MAG: ABC transporter ATP-binding protein [Alphaproteobacteria bacterium]
MIRVENLRKSFETKTETVHAIDDVSFEVAAGEMVTLLGPSGCGKTTTLRCVAGLERPTGGRIAVGDQAVVNMEQGLFVPPHLRNLGMVFQSYAIWPHMTVFENVAYALEGRKISKADRHKLTMDALETVQLAGHADRPAPRLSGGQQQRVAIARAIVGKPQALLFDEPLSNLDAKLRVEMRTELRRLQKQIGLTSIYVTHDQAEALAISDWIIVMKDGKIIERGRPTQIYRYPENAFTAQFIGTTNLIAGVVRGVEGERVGVETALGTFTGIDKTGRRRAGDKVSLSIRPEDLIADENAANKLSGTLDFAIFAGAAVEAEVACGGQKLFCLMGRDAPMTPGTPVSLGFAPDVAVVLPRE